MSGDPTQDPDFIWYHLPITSTHFITLSDNQLKLDLGPFNESARPHDDIDEEAEQEEIKQTVKRLRHGDQPLPTGNGEPCITNLAQKLAKDHGHFQLATDLHRRAELGFERYGTCLQPNNGRDVSQDLREELMDAFQYSLQRDVEEGELGLGSGMMSEVSGVLLDLLMGEYDDISEYDAFNDEDEEVRPVEPESVLHEAHRLVHEDRGDAYGHPIFDLTRTADISTAVIRHKLVPGVRLEPEDIAKMQIGTKLSRETFLPKRDNRVDIAGYAEVLTMIVEWYEANPGEDPRDFYTESNAK